jgi:hypothetical protein
MGRVVIKSMNDTISISNNSEDYIEVSIDDRETGLTSDIWLDKTKAEVFITELIKQRNKLNYEGRGSESK